MKYNPEMAPDPEKWLALEETQRIDLVLAYHRQMRAEFSNVNLHADVHVIVENQLAEGFDFAEDALDRLRAEGLDRHEAIHAIGSVLIGHVQNLMRESATTPDPNGPYSQALRTLTGARLAGRVRHGSDHHSLWGQVVRRADFAGPRSHS